MLCLFKAKGFVGLKAMTILLQEVSHTAGHDGGDDASGFSKLVRQINSRLETFEDTMKERIRRDDDYGDHFESKNESFDRSPSRNRRISRQEANPYMENIRLRDQQIEHVRNELRTIHNLLISHLSDGRRLRPNSSIESTPIRSIQSLTLPNARQMSKNTKNSQRSVVAPEKVEEDLMRKFLNRKLNGTQDFSVDGPRNNKKRRKRKGRANFNNLALSECLSQSWEDVSNIEAQSVC